MIGGGATGVSSTSSPLDEIEEVKTYRPTEQEFAEPMRYIENLYTNEKAHKYGIVKIIPPASFRPALAFDMFSERKLPTRY
jgi:histone demethylase JARID1